MSVSYDISWQGCLYDSEKQTEFLVELKQLAQLHNEVFFAEDKDETTLCFFDNITIEGNIHISSSLLYDIPKDCPEKLILPLKKIPSEKYYYSCNEVKLYGLQFLVKADPIYTRRDRNDLETVAYVFWGFHSTNEKIAFVRSNLARVVKSKNPIADRYDYKLVSPGLSSRFFKLWYVIHLYEYAEHYYFKKLDIENTMYWDTDDRSGFNKYLLENDPLATKKDIKETAFKDILEIAEKNARIGREMDEDDFKNGRSNNYSDSE